MAPCDFSLFHKFKRTLKCKRIGDVETSKQNATEQLLAIAESLRDASTTAHVHEKYLNLHRFILETF
jgi:hypothetical protein